MASTYSSLKIQLMATGENSGTWGNVTNVNLGTAIEEAITGSADVTFASANVTLTLTDTNATQAARNLRLNLTGTTGAARDLIVPAIEKVYIVNNGCADTVTVKNATGTGIAVPAGKTMYVYNNATNVVDAITHLTSLSVASGSNTAPSISTTGDPNTGIFFPAADTIAFTEGGVEAMRITSAGDVGIGTTSPGVKLDVTGEIRGTAGIVSSLGGVTGVYGANQFDANVVGLGSSTNHPLVLATNLAERMRIDSSGNVGIGTTTPGSFGRFVVKQAANTSIDSLALVAQASSTDTFISLGYDSASDTNRVFSSYITTGAFKPISFWTSDSERMRIDSSGNVGIGTATPKAKLDIRGIGSGGGTLFLDSGSSSGTPAYGHIQSQRYTHTNTPQIVMTGYDDGTFLEIYMGGGTWGAGSETNRIFFCTTPDYGTTGNTAAQARQVIQPDGSFTRCIPGATTSTTYPDFCARAWVNFNGTGTVAIRASGNVSSITDLDVGSYRVNLTTAMPDINYACSSGSGASNNAPDNGAYLSTAFPYTASAVNIFTWWYISSGVVGVYAEDVDQTTVQIFR